MIWSPNPIPIRLILNLRTPTMMVILFPLIEHLKGPARNMFTRLNV